MAFARIIIEILFMAPFIDPVKKIRIIYWGMFACIAIILTAFICGAAVRNILLY